VVGSNHGKLSGWQEMPHSGYAVLRIMIKLTLNAASAMRLEMAGD
jgi:hypothetical protein